MPPGCLTFPTTHKCCLLSRPPQLKTNHIKMMVRSIVIEKHLQVSSPHPSSTPSPSSAYPARLSCPARTVRAASSVSRVAVKTQRTSLPMMNTARWRSSRSGGAPCSALTGGTATVAFTGRGTARWIATAWCRSSALGPVDAFCLR